MACCKVRFQGRVYPYREAGFVQQGSQTVVPMGETPETEDTSAELAFMRSHQCADVCATALHGLNLTGGLGLLAQSTPLRPGTHLLLLRGQWLVWWQGISSCLCVVSLYLQLPPCNSPALQHAHQVVIRRGCQYQAPTLCGPAATKKEQSVSRGSRVIQRFSHLHKVMCRRSSTTTEFLVRPCHCHPLHDDTQHEVDY